MAEASATISSADVSSSSPRNNNGNENNNNNNSTNIKLDDDDNENDTPLKSRKPSDVALTQQRMKSWQPLLDPKWIIAAYLAIGIIFIPTGK